MRKLILFMPDAPWPSASMSGNSIVLIEGGAARTIHCDDLVLDRITETPEDFAAISAAQPCLSVAAQISIDGVNYPVSLCLDIFNALIAKRGAAGNKGLAARVLTGAANRIQAVAASVAPCCGAK